MYFETSNGGICASDNVFLTDVIFNFVYLFKEKWNVILGLNKSFSEFLVGWGVQWG